MKPIETLKNRIGVLNEEKRIIENRIKNNLNLEQNEQYLIEINQEIADHFDAIENLGRGD
jgi:hypothetical protein